MFHHFLCIFPPFFSTAKPRPLGLRHGPPGSPARAIGRLPGAVLQAPGCAPAERTGRRAPADLLVTWSADVGRNELNERTN